MQTQASATNKVEKTFNQLLLFKKVKKDEMVCQGILSSSLVKVTGLWWIKRIYRTTAFPLQTRAISSTIKNQHREKYNHFIHQIIPQCWDSPMGWLVTPETEHRGSQRPLRPCPTFCQPKHRGPRAMPQSGTAAAAPPHAPVGSSDPPTHTQSRYPKRPTAAVFHMWPVDSLWATPGSSLQDRSWAGLSAVPPPMGNTHTRRHE